jgi:hypothetical protein
VPVAVSPSRASIGRAMPKSVTFASPFPFRSTFWGLTSRWTNPFSWANASAWAISIASSRARSTGSGPERTRSCLRFSPATYSKTMKGLPPSSPRSITATMLW